MFRGKTNSSGKVRDASLTTFLLTKTRLKCNKSQTFPYFPFLFLQPNGVKLSKQSNFLLDETGKYKYEKAN